jgi:hypothetical protein
VVLNNVEFTGAKLSGTNFSLAEIGAAKFGNVDLREAKGLSEIIPTGPSTIGTDTIAKSKGSIPKLFLRCCGLSDIDIESAKLANPHLSNEELNEILYKIYDLRGSRAIQISPLFISYSHRDGEYVDKVGGYLNQKGIRYWRDIHKAIAGPLEQQADRAIRQNPTVLLILSKYSLKSDWVEHEVRTARELGKELGRHVLCPVALDDSWKDGPWPKRIME